MNNQETRRYLSGHLTAEERDDAIECCEDWFYPSSRCDDPRCEYCRKADERDEPCLYLIL